MDLLLLVAVFAGLGYILGVIGFGRRDEKSEPVGRGWRTLFERSSFSERFRDWVTGEPGTLFPANFRSWINGLTDAELRDFVRLLAEYSQGLDYDLPRLVEGGLDHDPVMRQVFVEAITVYSAAYRKAKQAHKKNEPEQPAANHDPENRDGKKPAEKAANRHHPGNGGEVVETASTD